MPRLRVFKVFQDDRLRRKCFGKELASEGSHLADIVPFDRRAGAYAGQSPVTAAYVLLEAANKAADLDATRASIGMHLVQHKVAHLIMAKNALVLAAHEQQF